MFINIKNTIINNALKRLARNSGLLLAAESVATLIGLVQFPLVARILGAEEYGKAILIISWVGLIGSLLGIQTRKTIVKYLSLFSSKDESHKSLAIVKLGLILNISLSTVVCTTLYIAAPTLSIWILDSETGAILFRIIILRDYFASTTGTTVSVLRVLDKFKFISIINAVSSIFTFAFVALALLNDYKLLGYLYAVSLIPIVQSIILLIYSTNRLNMKFGTNWWNVQMKVLIEHKTEIKTMLLSMKLDSLRKIATDKVDIVLLGFFVDIYNVGLYKMSKQLAGYISKLSNPIYSAIYPELANLYHNKGKTYLTEFIRKLTNWISIATIFSIITTILLANKLVPIIFGAEYANSLPIFYIIMLMHVWLALIWAPGLLLTLGKANALMKINLTSTLVMLVLLIGLVPTWGTTGAAIAIVLNYWTWSIIVLWYTSRIPGIELWKHSTSVNQT
ncbi:MAG TPA: hypothetical protein DGM69_01655 [Chloroflexi bacterium]|nr:hypothetical protein [Chloroflexota bacterium]|tara:strand:- start:286 stop:1635 length:1350 start_codon:yes stop_codon:yes gene_type:complete